jgi:DNA invertase Pin-like site-specific DNA recombinase
MNIGYARTSTVEQVAGFEAQVDALIKNGVEPDRIYKEQVSSVQKRDELESAIDFIRDGDTLIVSKLDRLARSVFDLLKIIECLKEKKATLKILDLGIDTATPTGQLMINLLGSIAQFEREIMLERQREGIAKAKADGKYKGGTPTAMKRKDEVIELKSQGLGINEIVTKTGISRTSVWRILKAA